MQKINELTEIYTLLKKNTNDFLNKLKKDGTMMIIKKINDKIYISVKDCDLGKNCLNGWSEEYKEYKTIKNCCYFLEQDINQYEKSIIYINENYNEIKKNIGIKQLRLDSIDLKERMLKTQDTLYNLLNKYEWEF
jgi:hypothetical protein